ncbi:flagellar hook-associated protein FlgK [Clostridium paraputrificum]|uniref:flagellar hook-associated protein FlgK n=1 Tax=Clostridium paraputrificum TaxID=29363 RepID=UPI003D34911E
MSGLFSTFNIAKRGLSVSQKTIDVTSHNISNSNTPGYSRQRAKIETTRPYGGNTMGSSVQPGQLGTGAQVQAIERVRDEFLDYQVRGETSTLGKYDVRNKFLYEVENIFNEPSDTGISTLMGKFFDSFQELSKQPHNSNARTVVAQQTLAMTDAINHAYTKLEQLEQNAQQLLKTNVTDINSKLNQIDQLNKEIISVKTSGQSPNDLMDKRDTLLDELSYKFNITIDKEAFEGINVKPSDVGGMKVPNLVNASQNSDVARFSYISSIEKDPNQPNVHVITYYKLGSMDNGENKQTLRVTDLSDEQVKELNSSRILWANSEGQATKADGFPIKDGAVIGSSELMLFKPQTGEVSGNISIQADIQNYKDELNKLAKSIAFSVNAIHSGLSNPINGGGNPDRDYLPFFVNKDIVSYNRNGEVSNLDQTLLAESEITAKNITINKELIEDVMKIKTKTHDNDYAYSSQNTEDGEADGARALAIAQLRDTLLRVQDFGVTINSREDLFNSSKGGSTFTNNGMTISNNNDGMKMDSYYKDTIDRLGIQAQEAARVVNNQENMLGELENSRDSISGVSLDEEMANLIQFQHAYNANAKIISTVDELLEVVVNGLKR